MSEAKYRAHEYASQFCHVFLIPIEDVESGRTIGAANTAARAKLFASAPELCAALENLIGAYKREVDWEKGEGAADTADDLGGNNEEYRQAKAALAKARGEILRDAKK